MVKLLQRHSMCSLLSHSMPELQGSPQGLRPHQKARSFQNTKSPAKAFLRMWAPPAKSAIVVKIWQPPLHANLKLELSVCCS